MEERERERATIAARLLNESFKRVHEALDGRYSRHETAEDAIYDAHGMALEATQLLSAIVATNLKKGSAG